MSEKKYYEIGKLILIHDDAEIEVFASGKDELTELEEAALHRQIEHIVGRAAWEYVDEKTSRGWFFAGGFRTDQ